VPEADFEALHGLAKGFFGLPQAEKDRIAMTRCKDSGRGYQRLGENMTLGRRDWHEAIDFYAEPGEPAVDFARLPPAAAARMRPFVLGRNQWPAEPAGFRAAAELHFGRMAVVGGALMEAMAAALGLPGRHFQPLMDRSFWCVRVIGYPPIAEAAGNCENVGTSVGEHTDYGCWTLLAQDETPGALEVRLADGKWVAAEPLPGALVVNLGDMLSVWTRGRFRATPHRVHQTQASYRTSVAFFHEPNFDAFIQPLEAAAGLPREPAHGAAGPADIQQRATSPLERAMRDGGLIYGEHVFAKFQGNFDFSGDR